MLQMGTNQYYRKALDKLGMSVNGAGHFFGIHPKTSARYARDDLEMPDMMRMLLALMIKLRVRPETLRKMADLKVEEYTDRRYNDPDDARDALLAKSRKKRKKRAA